MEKIHLSPKTLERAEKYIKEQKIKENRERFGPGIHIRLGYEGEKPKGISICPKCNNGLYIDQKFCDKCGTQIDWKD